MTYPFDLGTYSRPLTAATETAREWARRGLIWCYGYHHEEAIACFDKALADDPRCPLALWGRAYALGPNYNFTWDLMDPKGRAEALSAAHAATLAAMAHRHNAAPAERALIEALPARYPAATAPEDPRDMRAWNSAFADAMRDAHQGLPDDLDVRAIYTEALLVCTPWRMWDLNTGKPGKYARTEEAQAVLEEALDNDSRAMAHPGLLHLYVHLMEMSPTPEKALRAGDALRHLVPDSGHLAHMPTHIDVLCGDYASVVRDNQRAVIADRKEYERSGGMNFYTAYRQHNFHFTIYGAMFAGQLEPALAANQELIASTPPALLQVESPPMADFLEGYLAFGPHILVRFGRWQDILELDMPEDPVLHCTLAANVLYAKGVAHAALGNVAEAEEMQRAFEEARAAVPESRQIHNNTVVDLLAIGSEMLAGEIAYRKGDYDTAFAHLRQSVALDDALPYDEPWGWMQPTRHALGALLLEQGRADEAEAVFREDLGFGDTLNRAQIHPDNVWALRGLYDCLTARGAAEDARFIAQRLAVVEARADAPVRASCFCAQKAMAGA
ncbi:MAG: tetratricopeptide repeat protein [Pseudomonadota bacterium]